VASQLSNNENLPTNFRQSIWGFEGVEQRRGSGTKLLLKIPSTNQVTIKHAVTAVTSTTKQKRKDNVHSFG